jgi:hypothetical protein
MIPQLKKDKDLDDWLRAALPDDLPPAVAIGMRERIDRFRAGPAEGGVAAGAWSWLLRRGVWAALSILMLAAGILLQAAKTSSPLAERISSIKAASLSLGQIRK